MRFWGALGALKWTPLGPKAAKKGHPFSNRCPGRPRDPKMTSKSKIFGVILVSFFVDFLIFLCIVYVVFMVALVVGCFVFLMFFLIVLFFLYMFISQQLVR